MVVASAGAPAPPREVKRTRPLGPPTEKVRVIELRGCEIEKEAINKEK